MSSFTTGMAQAQASVSGFQNALGPAHQNTKTFYEGLAEGGEFATGSERGVRRMEQALGGLSASAIGAAGGMGTLAEGLLLFGTGSALTVGILGIAAAIGLLVQGLEKGPTVVQNFTKENEKLAKSFEEGIGPIGKHRLAIDELRQKYADYMESARTILDVNGKVHDSFMEFVTSPFGDPWNTKPIYDAANAASALNDILREQEGIQKDLKTAADKLAEANARVFLPILEGQDKLRDLQRASLFETPQRTDAEVRHEAEVRAAGEGKSPADQKRAGDAAVQLAHLEEQIRAEEELRSLAEERARAEHKVTEAADETMEHLQVQNAEVAASIRAFRATGHTGEAFWSDADIARVERMKLALQGITVDQQQIIDLTIQHAHAERELQKAEEAARTAAKAITEETRRDLQQMRDIGKSAIQQLVDGMAQGSVDFGRILQGIITKLITDNVTNTLFAALGIASPSKVGIEAGQYVAQGLALGMTGSPTMMGLGDMRLRLSADLSGMPPALNPFEAARDATTQRWFREATLVAHQSGFVVPS